MTEIPDRLWTPTDLAAFLGLAPATITSMSSRTPERLPPRVASLTAPRWVPDVVRAWAVRNSGSAGKGKGGRPRG